MAKNFKCCQSCDHVTYFRAATALVDARPKDYHLLSLQYLHKFIPSLNSSRSFCCLVGVSVSGLRNSGEHANFDAQQRSRPCLEFQPYSGCVRRVRDTEINNIVHQLHHNPIRCSFYVVGLGAINRCIINPVLTPFQDGKSRP
jgi:hypothetical protein